MAQDTCLFKFFFVKKEKKYGSSSANCFSKFLKLIVLESNLGGVPVFNLPILKLHFFNCSLKPVLGFSLKRPAGVLSSPICINPFKNVPVVKINLLQLILLSFDVTNPLITFFLKMHGFSVCDSL